MSDIIDKTREFVGWAVKDHEEAMLLLDQLYFVAHLWDDLIDRDKDRTNEDINRAMVIMLFELPRNDFYMVNFGHLNGILIEVTSAWMDANLMEGGKLCSNEHNTAAAQAYTLRTLYNTLVVACAFCIGGFNWARNVSKAMRETSEFMDGCFEEYLKTFREESHV